MRFPFLWGNHSLIFDWNKKILMVSFQRNGNYTKEIPLGEFPIVNFFTVAGYIYFLGEMNVKAEYKLSRENIVIDFIPAKKPKETEKAILLYTDDKALERWAFNFKTLDLAAFLVMLAKLDKALAISHLPPKQNPPPERILFLEKKNGIPYVEGIEVNPVSATRIYENLKKFLLTGATYAIIERLEGGRIAISGDRLEVFKEENGKFVPLKELILTPETALRTMSVLNPY